VRKDVAGYDLKSLLVGSEGTLAIITGAWLRLLPAPEAALPVVAFYQGAEDGTLALRSVLQNGLTVAVLEYLEGAALAAAAGSFPAAVPDGAGFAVIAEADGTAAEAAQLRDDLVALLGPDALSTHAPIEARAVRELWQWRDGVSLAVTAQRGGKVSEDIAVPLDRLGEAIQGTLEIGARHGLETCSWGHAGDGNLHSTFLIDSRDPDELARAEAAADELFDLALRLGGTVSGEHGTGVVKRSALSRQMSPAATRLHEAIKDVFDPKGLLNPGKKMPL
jgi:FAD/FMN-containing dehydrogenase